jgi:hypothetical protein
MNRKHTLLHELDQRGISLAHIVLDAMNMRAYNPAISYKRQVLN